MKKIIIILGLILSILSLTLILKYNKVRIIDSQNNLTHINSQDILKITLNHQGVSEKDCTIISNEFIYEDNIPIYTTIFYHNGIRYEYKTNGYTGDIISIVKLNEKAIE